ncbi:MAG: hypothetical protein J6N21_22510, partial [Butyrivibrio sp.]|nr:hypothetical protein [Butyrivibrio sp.]
MADYRYPSSTKGGAQTRILLSLTGIMINVMLAFLMDKIGMPLFLDAIGTIAVAAVGGLFPGILTAVMTNAICGIFDQNAVYFGFLNALIAIFTVWYIRKFSQKKISSFIMYILIVAFVSGSISAVINWNLLDGAQVAKNSETTELFASTIGGNLFWAYYIYTLLRNILDKGLSAAVAWLLLILIPDNILHSLERGNWKQEPLSRDEIQKLKVWGKDTRHSMGRRTTAIVVSTSLILIVVTGWIGF